MSSPSSPNFGLCRAYYFDALSGAGKNFTVRVLQSILELHGQKAIAVATSAVPSSILDRGRTARYIFKIPIPCFSESVCNISTDTKLTYNIR